MSSRRTRRSPHDRARVNFRRDLSLYWRVLRRLGRYRWIVVATVTAMVLESALMVVSIGMVKPALDLIFLNQLVRFDHYAREFPLEASWHDAPYPGSPSTLTLGGWMFLDAHAAAASAAVASALEDRAVPPGRDATDPDPHRLRVVRGAFHLLDDAIYERFVRDLPDGATIDPDPAAAPADRAALGPARPLRVPPPRSDRAITSPGRLDAWKAAAIARAEATMRSFRSSMADDVAFRYGLLKLLAASLLALTLLKVCAAFFSNYLANWLGFAVIRDIRQDLYAHMLELDFKFFADRSMGDLISRVTADLSALQTVVSMVFSRFLQSPIKVLAIITGMIILSPELTAISLLGIVPVTAAIIYLLNKVRRATRRLQAQRADLTNVLQETFGGIRTVKAYGMEQYELSRFGKRNERLTREQNRAEMFGELSSQLNEVIFVLMLGGLLLLGGHYILVAGGERVSASDFITFIVMMGALWGPVRKWGKSLVKVQSGLTGAERVFEILDATPSMSERPDAVALAPDADTTVRFEDVRFAYDEGEDVLRGITLEVPRGSVVALAGRTGSGKTTLAHLLPRFYDVTGGCVRVGGHDVRDLTLRSLRERIAFVSQHVILFDDTVRANIAYGRPDIPLERIEAAARAAHLHDEILAMPQGYDTPVGGLGIKLSGGQRQRVAMARAILRDAPIVILDEATSALDVETENFVQQALERLMKGRSVIVIAHRLSTIQGADRICFLKQGRIVEEGTHDELMERDGEYARYQRLNAGNDEARPGDGIPE